MSSRFAFFAFVALGAVSGCGNDDTGDDGAAASGGQPGSSGSGAAAAGASGSSARGGTAGTASGQGGAPASGGSAPTAGKGGSGGTSALGGAGGTAGTVAGSGAGGTSAGAAGSGGTSAGAAGSGGPSAGGAGSAGASGSASGGTTAGNDSGGKAGSGGTSAGAAGGGGKGGQGGAAGQGTSGSASGGTAGAPDGWVLSWSDEFDGANGASPDASKWAYDIGGDGWGNNELEYYTDRPENVATNGAGQLVITLKSETYMNRSYTSARLKTLGKFERAYGRFEARVKVPRGQGVWPAFWMLGADIATNVWPNCGEIDIMENAGREPRINHGSLHGPGYSGGSPLTGTYTLPSGALADDFHVYAVEWETNVVRFYVDTNLYQTKRNTDVPSGREWVYDHPFFMILNIAIGGPFGGAPDGTTMLPQTMTVDYVRVYARP